jgi:hypothetical protein
MRLAIAVMGLAALLATTRNSNAESCNTFLTDIESHITSDPLGEHIVTMDMVTLANALPVPPAPFPLHGQATYSESPYPYWGFPAYMSYVPAHQVGTNHFPATLQGTVSMFFSDQRWVSNLSQLTPFSPSNTSPRNVVIFLGDYPYPPIRYAKGDVVIADPNNPNRQPPSFKASCQYGLMYGFIGQNEIVAINLNKTKQLILRR